MCQHSSSLQTFHPGHECKTTLGAKACYLCKNWYLAQTRPVFQSKIDLLLHTSLTINLSFRKSRKLRQSPWLRNLWSWQGFEASQDPTSLALPVHSLDQSMLVWWLRWSRLDYHRQPLCSIEEMARFHSCFAVWRCAQILLPSGWVPSLACNLTKHVERCKWLYWLVQALCGRKTHSCLVW